MKKIFFSVIILTFLVSQLPCNPGARASTSDSDIQKDYKQTMDVVKEQMDNGNAKSPEDVSAYKEFKNKYSEKQINDLTKQNFKKRVDEAKNISSNQELSKNDKKINQLSDGSLVVAESTDKSDDESNTIQPYSTKKSKSGKGHVSRYKVVLYGPHPVATLKNRTHYKVYKKRVKIISVSSQGSSSFYPAKITRLKSKKAGNNTKSASGITRFKYTAGLPGKELLRKYPSVITKIKIKSHKGKKVRYSVTHKRSGI